MKILWMIAGLAVLLACGSQETPQRADSAPNVSKWDEVSVGMDTAMVKQVLGTPVSRVQMGFGITRWYYSDTSCVVVEADSVTTVVRSVAQAQAEMEQALQEAFGISVEN